MRMRWSTILTQPKNALVKQYQRLFELEEHQTVVPEDALRAIAKRAIDRKTGARGPALDLEEILCWIRCLIYRVWTQ